jgi:hypothetical protein
MLPLRRLGLAAAATAAFFLAPPGASAQMTLVGDYPGSFPGARLGTTAPGTVAINTQPGATVIVPPAGGTSPVLAPGGGYAAAGRPGTVMIDTRPGLGLTGQAAPIRTSPSYRQGGPVLYSSTPAYRQATTGSAAQNPAYRAAPQAAAANRAVQPSSQPRLYSTVRPGGATRR